VISAGIEQALVVSSRGAWLINAVTGARTDVTAAGGALTVDPASKSFVVRIPDSLLPVTGSWRVRLSADLADAAARALPHPTSAPPAPPVWSRAPSASTT